MGDEKETKTPETEKIIENPQTSEEYTKNLTTLVSLSEAETKKLNETVKKVTDENEKLAGEVAELKGEIERVRVNMPPLIDHATGKEIPVISAGNFAGMTNEQVKEVYEWWANGPVYDALRKMGKVTSHAQKEHDEYVKKMEPIWAQKAATSEAFQGLKNPRYAQMQRKAAVTGSMGIEQTGYGEEWAPGVLGGKVIALATYDSVILKEAESYPVSYQKAWWPTADYSGYACKWPAAELDSSQEDADVIATSYFALESKWGYVLALLGRQFIVNCRQYGIAAVDSVLTFMKHAAAVKFDTVAWTGDISGSADVADGLEVDSGITDVELTAGDDTFAEILHTDLINFTYELEKRYRPGAKIYGSPKFCSTVRLMEDSNGNLIQPPLYAADPLAINGKPLVEVEVANETEEDGGAVCVYGNLKNTFAYGFLEDMIFESTAEKYWVEGGVLFRLEFWGDMGVTLPTAMRRLLFNTA